MESARPDAVTCRAGPSLSAFSYTYNEGNQRVGVDAVHGSLWWYRFNERGEVVCGERQWPDATQVGRQQFEYRHDAIGNRTVGGWRGDELGWSLRWSTNTVNRLNQYTARTVPGVVGVSGEAVEGATVTLWWGTNDWAPVIGQGRYWYGEVWVNNATGGGGVVVTNLGVVRGTPDRLQGEVRTAVVVQTPELLVHDLDGNLVWDGRWVYSWDAENRLVRVMSWGSVDRRRMD